MPSLNRREFVVAATAACACAVCPQLVGADPPPGKIDVGALSDYPSNVISDKFKKQYKILVVRNGDRIYSFTATCTHKGGTVNLKNNQIKCPLHGSTYSERGTVTGGPATRSLVRYAISLDEKNRLIVDKSKQFAEKDWEDPASFVKVS